MKIKRLRKINVLFITFLIIFSFKNVIVKAEGLSAQYNMDLIFNQKDKSLDGLEKVIIKNDLDKELDKIVFHLYPDSYNDYSTQPLLGRSGKQYGKITKEEIGDIKIKKVLVNDKEVKYTEDKQVLKIDLNETLKKNKSIQVCIEFKLKIPMGTARLGYNEEVYSLTNWYPILSIYDVKENKWDETPFHPIGESNYSDVANYNVKIKVPNNFVVVSTGEEKESEVKKDEKTFILTAENVRDFVIIMSPHFKVMSKEMDGINVNSYYIADKDSKGEEKCAKEILDIAAEAVKFFSHEFGKYPYKELDIVETYLAGGAMEYPQIIQMCKYDDYILDMEDTPFLLEAAVHEVGHQWWYVTVGNNEFKEPFLDESFTAFSTAYYFDKKEDEYSSKGIKASLRDIYVYIDERSNIEPKKISSSVDNFKEMYQYNTTIYKKGALILEDLRNRVGEEKFKEIMQEYFKRFKFKNSTIQGFLGVIENKSGKSVRDSIEKSLNGDKYVPKNLELTSEDSKKINNKRKKSYLSQKENQQGMTMTSVNLRGLNNEKIIIVKPSNLDYKEKAELDNFYNFVKETLYGIEDNLIITKEDKDIKEEDIKNNNLILLGNSCNNKLLNNNLKDLPIRLNKNEVSGKNLMIRGEDISGAFICKNPKNDNKLILSLFWTQSIPKIMEIDSETPDTIIIKMKDNKYFRGRI
ncbi:M1 family metallopeptidase [Clostridium lundense]|uniref:M1 family metallopeptidase n=1 Tax=Clostridium lundense TaxID=319475 RepID=UPI00048415EF|nr:M1 family metallopeptidase [Clostridium lundense]